MVHDFDLFCTNYSCRHDFDFNGERRRSRYIDLGTSRGDYDQTGRRHDGDQSLDVE